MDTEREAYVSGTFPLLLVNIAVLVIGFFSRPILAKLLGPEQYGLFALIFSTSAVLCTVLLFSLNSGVLYFSAKWADEPEKIARLASTAGGIILGLGVILFLPLFYLTQYFAGMGWESYVASFALGLGMAIFVLLQSFQQGLQRFKGYGLTNLASSFLAASFSIAASFLMSGAVGVSIARALSFFLILAVGLFVWRRFGRMDASIAKTLLTYSLPLGIAAIGASLIVVVDRYFLAQGYPASVLGFYDIAYSLVTAVLPFTSSLLIVMAPKVIREEQKLKAYHTRLISIKTILLSTAGIGLFYFSDIIVTVLLGPAYAPASLMLKIIAVALPLMGIYALNGSLLSSIGKTAMAGAISVLLVVASFAFNYFLVPPYGGVGSAMANILAYLVVCGAGSYYLRVRKGLQWGDAKFQLALFVAFIATYFWVEQFGFGAKVLAVAVFAALTVAMQWKTVREVGLVISKVVPGLKGIQTYLK
ncbi:flippase [Candidatus Micrarchaeota archaeon]|nr:flippase [Candidatus Micrarchaeota archaeon]